MNSICYLDIHWMALRPPTPPGQTGLSAVTNDNLKSLGGSVAAGQGIPRGFPADAQRKRNWRWFDSRSERITNSARADMYEALDRYKRVR